MANKWRNVAFSLSVDKGGSRIGLRASVCSGFPQLSDWKLQLNAVESHKLRKTKFREITQPFKKSVMLFSEIEHEPRVQSFGPSNTRINHLFTKRNLKSMRSNSPTRPACSINKVLSTALTNTQKLKSSQARLTESRLCDPFYHKSR